MCFSVTLFDCKWFGEVQVSSIEKVSEYVERFSEVILGGELIQRVRWLCEIEARVQCKRVTAKTYNDSLHY